MAAREAVYLTADALDTSLQTKLGALSTESGENVPQIADIRDVFSSDELDGPDWPQVQVVWDVTGGDFELERFEKYDVGVPLTVRLVTMEPDTGAGRATLAYGFRGIMQVLHDITQQSRNGVRLIQYVPRGAPQVGLDVDDRLTLEIPLTARMRDTQP